MDHSDVETAYASYLADFVALGRGDRDDREVLLEHYAVPLVLTSEDGAHVLTSAEDVLAATTGQIDGLRAAGYDRSERLSGETVMLNASSALLHAVFARVRADGSQIEELSVSYLIIATADGPRISAMALRTR